MNAGQRHRKTAVEKLIDIAHAHGLGSIDLRDMIHYIVCSDAHPDSDAFVERWRRADRINRAGLMAQIYFLLDVMGKKTLTMWLEEKGNALDGFVKGFTTDPEAREKDIGRNNVDCDGCVVID